MHIQLTQLSVMSDLQALWRSVSVDGMTEADISAYLQNGELGQAHALSHFHDTYPIPSPGTSALTAVGIAAMEGSSTRKRKVRPSPTSP